MASKESTSFARLVKEESAKAERSLSEKKALLSSFVRINGYLRIRGKQEGLELSSENSAIAKCVYQYLHELYGVDVRFAYTRKKKDIANKIVAKLLKENDLSRHCRFGSKQDP